jgi:hypothetical protein
MLTPTENREAARSRFVKCLGIIVDEMQPDDLRLATVRAVRQALPVNHPFQTRTATDLLNAVKNTWDTRQFLVNGRGVERRVLRPPQSLADVW